MSLAITPFLVNTPILDDEYLLSYLIRAAKDNFYSTESFLSVIRQTLRDNGVDDSLELPRHPLTYRILSQMMRVSEQELFDHTIHKFAPAYHYIAFRRNKIMLSDEQCYLLTDEEVAARLYRSKSKAIFCPHCLAENGYDRLSWHERSTSVCTKHQCLLEDHCSICGSSISTYDLVSCHCSKCNNDLRDVAPVSLSDEPLLIDAQKAVHGLLGIDRKVIEIPGISDPALYYVFFGIKLSIGASLNFSIIGDLQAEKEVGVVHSPRLCLLQNCIVQSQLNKYAVTALSNFPNGLFECMDRLRSGKKGTTVDLGLGAFYYHWLEENWKKPEFIVLQDAYNRYLVDACEYLTPNIHKSYRLQENHELQKGFAYISDASASEVLGIGKEQVRQLVLSGQLRGKFTDKRRVLCFVNQEDVQIMQKLQAQAIDLASTRKLLGATDTSIHSLMDKGLIETIVDRSECKTLKWMIIEESVLQLKQKIQSRLTKIPIENSDPLLGLMEVCQRSSKYGFDVGTIISKIINGEITVYQQSETELSFEKLLFVESLVEELKLEFLRSNGVVSLPTLAQQIGVKQNMVVRWTNTGVINPQIKIGSEMYFSSDSSIRFMHDYISTQEAGMILGVGDLTIHKWARNGRLHPVSGTEIDGSHEYRFERKEIVEISMKQKLSAPQMAKRLGISRSQMCERIRQGKIHPISGPGVDKCGHYLFLVDQ